MNNVANIEISIGKKKLFDFFEGERRKCYIFLHIAYFHLSFF